MPLALALVLILAAASPKASAAPVKATANAPADEYFGPFHMSALVIRSKIGTLGRAYRYGQTNAHDVLHDASEIEDAFNVWRERFPNDGWLAPTAFHLAQLYQTLPSDTARSHALSLYREITTTWPSSKEAHFSRERLAAGLPAPVVPATTPSATPSSATPSATPSGTPAPGASATPTATATAAASASPTVTPSTRPT